MVVKSVFGLIITITQLKVFQRVLSLDHLEAGPPKNDNQTLEIFRERKSLPKRLYITHTRLIESFAVVLCAT